jgi:hypothetical protein
MPAAFAFSPAEGVIYAPTTITMTGFTAASVYVVNITRGSGGSQHFQVTTDGSGAATVTFVPAGAGTHTVTANLLTPANEATATYVTGGN